MIRSVLCAGALLAAGCSSKGSPIVIVVPKGYTGMIRIVNDPTAPEIPLTDGCYCVVIPPNGVLPVRSLKPFQRWHSETVKYDDGSPLRSVTPGQRVEAGEDVVLIGLGSVSGGQEARCIEYFVGTMKRYDELRRKNPFGTPEVAK
jgi:hypothetical protein